MKLISQQWKNKNHVFFSKIFRNKNYIIFSGQFQFQQHFLRNISSSSSSMLFYCSSHKNVENMKLNNNNSIQKQQKRIINVYVSDCNYNQSSSSSYNSRALVSMFTLKKMNENINFFEMFGRENRRRFCNSPYFNSSINYTNNTKSSTKRKQSKRKVEKEMGKTLALLTDNLTEKGQGIPSSYHDNMIESPLSSNTRSTIKEKIVKRKRNRRRVPKGEEETKNIHTIMSNFRISNRINIPYYRRLNEKEQSLLLLQHTVNQKDTNQGLEEDINGENKLLNLSQHILNDKVEEEETQVERIKNKSLPLDLYQKHQVGKPNSNDLIMNQLPISSITLDYIVQFSAPYFAANYLLEIKKQYPKLKGNNYSLKSPERKQKINGKTKFAPTFSSQSLQSCQSIESEEKTFNDYIVDLVQRCDQKNDWETCVYLARKGLILKDAKAFSTAMSICSRASQFEAAWEIFNTSAEMDDRQIHEKSRKNVYNNRNFRPNLTHYAVMMAICIRHSKSEHILKLYEHLKANDNFLQHLIYVVAKKHPEILEMTIKAHKHLGDPIGALSVIEEIEMALFEQPNEINRRSWSIMTPKDGEGKRVIFSKEEDNCEDVQDLPHNNKIFLEEPKKHFLLKKLYLEGIKSCFLYAERDWPIAKHILYRYLNSFHMNANAYPGQQAGHEKLLLNVSIPTPLLNAILDICIKANQVEEALGILNGSHEERIQYNRISESTKALITYISKILYSSPSKNKNPLVKEIEDTPNKRKSHNICCHTLEQKENSDQDSILLNLSSSDDKLQQQINLLSILVFTDVLEDLFVTSSSLDTKENCIPSFSLSNVIAKDILDLCSQVITEISSTSKTLDEISDAEIELFKIASETKIKLNERLDVIHALSNHSREAVMVDTEAEEVEKLTLVLEKEIRQMPINRLLPRSLLAAMRNVFKHKKKQNQNQNQHENFNNFIQGEEEGGEDNGLLKITHTPTNPLYFITLCFQHGAFAYAFEIVEHLKNIIPADQQKGKLYSYYTIIMKRALNLATSSSCKEEQREMLEIASTCGSRLDEFWQSNGKPQDPLLAAYKLELNLLRKNLNKNSYGRPRILNSNNLDTLSNSSENHHENFVDDIPLICSQVSSYVYTLAVCVKRQNAPLILELYNTYRNLDSAEFNISNTGLQKFNQEIFNLPKLITWHTIKALSQLDAKSALDIYQENVAPLMDKKELSLEQSLVLLRCHVRKYQGINDQLLNDQTPDEVGKIIHNNDKERSLIVEEIKLLAQHIEEGKLLNYFDPVMIDCLRIFAKEKELEGIKSITSHFAGLLNEENRHTIPGARFSYWAEVLDILSEIDKSRTFKGNMTGDTDINKGRENVNAGEERNCSSMNSNKQQQSSQEILPTVLLSNKSLLQCLVNLSEN